MKQATLSRLIAVLLIAAALAWHASARNARSLAAIAANPTAYAQRQGELLHTAFFHNFLLDLVLVGVLVVSVELMAHLLRRFVLRTDQPDDGAA